MSLEIEDGEITDAIKMVKKECFKVEDMSPFEINQLAVQIVQASNVYDAADLISDSAKKIAEAIEYLNEA